MHGTHGRCNGPDPVAMPGTAVASGTLAGVTVEWPGPGRRPTVVRLMAEHAQVFLWNDSPGRDPDDAYTLDPADLGVSDELVARLTRWNDRYGRLALTGYTWPDPQEEAAWRREGLDLAHALQDELGPDIDVVYAEDGDGRPVRERRGR